MLIALFACSNEPLRPFDNPAKLEGADDDSLTRFIIGSGGDDEDRADAETITREVLLPVLRRRAGHDLQRLRVELDAWAAACARFQRVGLSHPLLRTSVSESLSELMVRASQLSVARLKHELWPGEPFPDVWKHAATIETWSVSAAALGVYFELLELEGRYARRLPTVFSRAEVAFADDEYGEHRSVVLLRNRIYIALTGDYTLTAGAVYDELVRRGIPTRRVPEDRPY